MLAALATPDDAQMLSALAVMAEAKADVLLLTDFDWDLRGTALAALQRRLQEIGLNYPHVFAPQPNTGFDTGFDLDGNGRLAEPRDAQGYGRFAGQHGMALLSRLPIVTDKVQDFSNLLWQDLPQTQIAGAALPPGAAGVLRLSSTGHWDVPIETAAGPLHLWAFSATTPVFDGPEDRNGRRNHDEVAFWLHYLNGDLAQQPAPAPFVVMGKANLDPAQGEGQRVGIAALLADDRLQDPQPTAPEAPPQNPTATADFGPGIGPLRVDYVLPAAGLWVVDAGVIWSDIAPLASDHRLVWVDLALP